MIQINDQEYANYSTNITWQNFSVVFHGQKRTGKAPFITFNINNKTFVGLELILADEMIKNCESDTKTNITEYLSDICYEDEKGWVSLITGKYDFYITRIDDHNFKIDFFVEDNEITVEDEEIKIYINDIIELLP